MEKNIKKIQKEVEAFRKAVQEILGFEWFNIEWPEIDTSKPLKTLKAQSGEYILLVYDLVSYINELQKEYKLPNLTSSIFPWNSIKVGKSKAELELEIKELFDNIVTDLNNDKNLNGR